MLSSELGKTLKEWLEKVCEIEKECYFCTRNEGYVLTIYWKTNYKKRQKHLRDSDKGFTFAAR